MIKSTSFQQFLGDKKDHFKNQVKRRANNDKKKKELDFQLLNEQIKENLLKRSVPLTKDVQDNYRNQYAVPNQIIISYSKPKKNNYSEAFEGKPDQEIKKLMKSFSGANHYKEEENQENKKPTSVVANKLQKILKIDGSKLSQHEQRNCLNTTPNIKQEGDLSSTQMQHFLQKIKNNSEKFLCDKSAKTTVGKQNDMIRIIKLIQQEFLDVKLESDQDCLSEVLNQLKAIFSKHAGYVRLEKELFGEIQCLAKIIADISIKLHKEELYHYKKVVTQLEEQLQVSLQKNESLNSQLLEKSRIVDQVVNEKEKLRKIIQRNILDGRSDQEQKRNNNSNFVQENEQLLEAVKKLSVKVNVLEEKEEKMIAVLVAIKKQGVDIEEIINEGISVEQEEQTEMEEILTRNNRSSREKKVRFETNSDQGYADDSVVNDSDESSFNYFGKSQALDSSLAHSIDQPHVGLRLDLMQINF